MAKQKNNRILTIFAAIFALIFGFFASFVITTYLTLPDSYYIPSKVEGSSYGGSTVGIDATVVKQNDLSIHFLELGNKYTGDCTLIDVGDTEVLIDAGSKSTSVPVIYDYIKKYVDGKLDYVVVTHAHEDHYAGFATGSGTDSLFDLFEVGTIIEFAQTNQTPGKKLYDNYTREKQEEIDAGAQCFTALECVNEDTNDKGEQAQRVFTLGEASKNIEMEILYQKFYEEKSNTENNYSVCLMINQNDTNHYLFTGDLEKEGEESLVSDAKNQEFLTEVTLYKAGHHGSKTSSSEALLSKIKPKVICVCCCAGSSEYTSKNENQFPTQEFVDRVKQFAETDKIYVTTLCINYQESKFESFNGTIVLCANSAAPDFKMMFSNNDTILKDTAWFAANRVW